MNKLIRLSDDLAERLRGEAFRSRKSQNQIVNELLENYFNGGNKGMKLNVIQRRPAQSKVAKETA